MHDPHDNEYIAAARGLHEQTPSQLPEPAVGDYVSGITNGRRWSGRIEAIDGNRLTIDVGGGWLAVPVADITH